jgi:predicted membrane-bound mannosyltransferase
MLRSQGHKIALAFLLLASLGHLAWQAWMLDTTYAADQRNPYLYAQTSPEILKLVAQVQSIASVLPQPSQMLIKVVAPEGDYWPLPWYLRSFKQVGWWEQVPPDPYAPVMIVAARLGAALDETKTHLMRGYFALRPGVSFELYVELGLWKQWLAQHPPTPDRE